VFVNEAQECLGGNGYIEESILPRLYRQAPLNSIWEGSGNVQCLDVLRALAKEPETGIALLHELSVANVCGGDLRAVLTGGASTAESDARRLVEALALGLQAAALRRSASPVAEAFVRSRIAAPHALAFGTLPAEIGLDEILARVL
jgi:putative acyl-CoA dehydrogenase